MSEGWARFQLQGTVGSGATGTVYVCYQAGLQRHVAIKELSPALTQQPMFLERFRAEVQTMARLQSPNCVRVFEFFETGGRAFLVEEFIQGSSIRRVAAAAGRLAPEQALGILTGALSGLGYAHALGLVHGDLKPSNILVDHEGVSKLVDFGQALSISGPGAEGGMAQGTPAYMSPEQVRGAGADYRSDVYSAGAVLFELLTGRPPYAGDSALAVMQMQVEAPVPDPRTVEPSLADPVARIVGRALSKDPGARQQSAAEFYTELGSAAAAAYGAGWEQRASVKALVATALAGAGAPAAAPTPAVPPAPGAAISEDVAAAATSPPATTPGASVAGTGGPVLKQGLHPVRFAVGMILSLLLIAGGLGFGGSKGILPGALAAATRNYFGVPPSQAGAVSGGPAAARGLVPVPKAGAADRGSATALVLDISGSMASPAQIPSGFPKAAELKQKQDAFGSLIEQAQSGKKVPVGTVIAGVSGIVDLIKLSSQLDDYLKARGIDPATISKLSALKVSAAALLQALGAEQQGLGIDHKAGLVTFSDSATVLGSLSSDLGGLATQIDALQTAGSTNMGDGLQNGLNLVQDQAGGGVVLLTDGWNNTGLSDDRILAGPVATAVARGIPICVIGIGESPFDVDQAFLTEVASRTGGAYYFVADRVSLAGDMLACHHTITGRKVSEFRGRVNQGQTVTAPQFTIPSGRRRLSVSLSWPGSDLDIEIKDSGGRAIGPSGSGTLFHQPGLSLATLVNPPPGSYTVRVSGKQVSAGGEDFFLGASTDGQTSDRHFDSVVGGAGATTGPLAGVRYQIRLAVTISALVAGIAMLLMTVRGMRRRLVQRRLAARGERLSGKVLVPGLLYLGVIGGLTVLVFAAGLNYLWETPLITLPKV
jgi:hypothetical protein